MNYTLGINFPGLPKRLNETLRMHHQVRNKYFKSIYETVMWLVHGKGPRLPLTKAKLTLIRCNYRTIDHDGCVGSMNPIVDGLVRAGVLSDDTYKVTGPWDVWQSYTEKGKQHVKIKIEERK